MTKTNLIVAAALLAAACTPESPKISPASPDMDVLAREYLYLELSMGQHDASHVDAYFGPAELQTAAAKDALSLDAILEAAQNFAARLDQVDTSDDAELAVRIDGLKGRMRALVTRIAINRGEKIAFDDESAQLFDSVAPDYDAAHFQSILDQIDAALPGDEPLSARVEAFNERFEVPPEKLSAVFEAAMAECRRRTLEHIALPEGESFTIEYVSDKPWTGYNWYKGDAVSLIQVNTDLPISISRAVDLGCHEGYPGHHTYNALLEMNLVRDKGWVEYSLYPLFSPQSLIAEGSGNYGVELAFPGEDRIEFEKTVLFPLAGLDPAEADRFYALGSLLEQLNFAGNEAARDYLDGRITRDEAVAWLVDYALSSRERAEQRVRFFDTYRSYVINYNHGEALVRDFVERGDADAATRWARFEKLLSSPMSPRDLETVKD